MEKRVKDGELNANNLKAALPSYLVEAIEYVTGGPEPAGADDGGAGADGG